jgi:hypothetical protein
MTDIFESKVFREDYDKLRSVSLNPEKHSAANAYEHCEQVRERALDLARQNECTIEEAELLGNLARVHDIGKILGTANPAKSVELLPNYGITDDLFVQLVKYHDTNLPWYLSAQKRQPPSDKAWRKMAGKVDMRTLIIFMVADRVDCPGGWKENVPLTWFINEAKSKGYLDTPVFVDGEILGESD